MQFVSLWKDEFLSFLLSKTNKQNLNFLILILRKNSSSEGNSPDFRKTRFM